jgi:hypothetical protein
MAEQQYRKQVELAYYVSTITPESSERGDYASTRHTTTIALLSPVRDAKTLGLRLAELLRREGYTYPDGPEPSPSYRMPDAHQDPKTGHYTVRHLTITGAPEDALWTLQQAMAEVQP